MYQYTRACFFLIPALLSAISAAAQPPQTTALAVRLYNVAKVSADAKARATSEASEIFERVGISLTWLDCSGPVPEPNCNSVRGPRVVNLRLMPASMQPKGLPRGIFGFAVMSAKGGFSSIANVYLERVSEISDGRKYRRSVLLGSMMAHELGHLLLGVNSHAKKGLMTIPWGPRVLLAADRGMLSFSKGEAARIRTAVQERLEAKNLGGRPARRSFEVRLHNYAALSQGVLKMATGTTDKVFKSVGAEIRWVDCTPDSPAMDPTCREPSARQTRVLRIVPPEMTAKMPASGIEFGRALLTEDASRGTFASVYWGRVQELAAGRARTVCLGIDTGSVRLKEVRILGYVLAHELGHLFGVHHSKRGVMNGPWTPSELAELLRGSLRFQRGEEARIRQSLAEDLTSP